MIHCLLCTEALMREDRDDVDGISHRPIPDAPLAVFIQYGESILPTNCGVLCATCAAMSFATPALFRPLRHVLGERRE